jgi:hypothetical protein
MSIKTEISMKATMPTSRMTTAHGKRKTISASNIRKRIAKR